MQSPKPLLLVFPFDLLSHQVRCVKVALTLSAHYEIRFASSRKWSAVYKAEGFGEFAYTGFDPEVVMRDASRFSFDWLRAAELERVAGEMKAVLEEMNPAAVMGDAMPGLRLVSQMVRVPCINLINAYMSDHYLRTRYVPQGHAAYRIQKWLPRALFRWGESRQLRQAHAPFRELRKKWNLPSASSFFSEWQGDMTLVCDDAQLFPMRPLPAGHFITGPLRLRLPGMEAVTTEAIAFLQEVPQERRIVVSMGSSGDLARVKALQDSMFTDYRIVIAGESSEEWNAGHLRHWPLLNLAQLLPHASVVISHGGNGTLYEALIAGIPVLSSPVHFEQGWNAQAAQAAGVGETLPAFLPATDLKKRIERWAGRSLPLQVKESADEVLRNQSIIKQLGR